MTQVRLDGGLRCRLDFGKHKGKHIEQVDNDYLRWMIEKFPKSSPWWKVAADALQARGDEHLPLPAAAETDSALDERKRQVDRHELLSHLRSCTIDRDLRLGRRIHSRIMESGKTWDVYIVNTLINMYRKCGSMVEARSAFESIQEPDVVHWNTLLMGYVENGQPQLALDMFSRMKKCGCTPTSLTYVAPLKACTSLAGNGDGGGRTDCLNVGRAIHLDIGDRLDHFLQSTLIGMYAKCGSIAEAHNVFDSIHKPDVVSWTALILGYAESGEAYVALELFAKMKAAGCNPNSVTYIAALKACAFMGALSRGRKLHQEITEFTPPLVTCLVDFYAKCGSMVESREVFDSHVSARNIITWTALLAGYGKFGDSEAVFSLIEQMKDEGLRPNAVTFLCLLLSCSHAGLVGKAQECFEAMPRHYGLPPTIVHYNCMVDVLGRGNQLDKAVRMMQKMPCKPDAVTWSTLLGACRKWKNVEIGREAFQAWADIDRKNASPYVLMADLYGSRGMWKERERVLESRIRVGACKQQEQAYVTDEVGKTVQFLASESEPT